MGYGFIEDENVQILLASLIDTFGANFNAPYNYDTPLGDAVAKNTEDLLNLVFPAGVTTQGMADTSQAGDMAAAITTVAQWFSSFMAMYGMLLPIFGVITGIIEILCCLSNPFCLIPAIVRLFKKYLPAFMSIFPTFAVVLMFPAAIKVIMAIIMFVITELIPTYELIKANVEKAYEGITDLPDSAIAGDAGIEKIKILIIDLLNRVGLLNVFKPIIDILEIYKSLKTKRPCKSSSRCCSTEETPGCPPAVYDPPSGTGIIRSKYEDGEIIAWYVEPLTGAENMGDLIPLHSSVSLSAAGSSGDVLVSDAHFYVTITKHSGTMVAESLPITHIYSDGKMEVSWVDDKYARSGVGVLYTVEPNFEHMISDRVIGVTCSPEIIEAKDAFAKRFAENSALDKFPQFASFGDDYNKVIDDTRGNLNDLSDLIDSGIDEDTSAAVGALGTDITEKLLGYLGDLGDLMNSVLDGASDLSESDFTSDKQVVLIGADDFATISVTPRDISGALLGSHLPDGVTINIDVISDFGAVSDVGFSKDGVFTAKLESNRLGLATVTAKISGSHVTEFDGVNTTIKSINVNFVSNAILPKRRSGSRTTTVTGGIDG